MSDGSIFGDGLDFGDGQVFGESFVIQVDVTESVKQTVSGIPNFVTVQTNVPSNVYYTLDGSEPTNQSLLLIGQLPLPTDNSSVTLRLFASNGYDDSLELSFYYAPDVSKVRRPSGKVEGITNASFQRWGVFGDQGLDPNFRWNGSGNVPMDTGLDGYPNGYDASGTGTTLGSTDLPKDDYKFIFSETDRIGKMGKNIGTLPHQVTILPSRAEYPQITTNIGSKTFNPRALVIYQNWDEPNPSGVQMLNRSMFSLENPQISSNGFNTGFDKGNVTGGFVKAVFNEMDCTTTYYYRDSNTNQWIISKEKFHPKSAVNDSLANIVTNKKQKGIGKIYMWIPFFSSRLR